MDHTFRFHSIAEFHKFCGLPNPEHPLISLIDYSRVSYPVNDNKMKWIQHFYSVGLKRNVSAKFNYGQQEYDFDAGVLSFVSPQQFLRIEMNPEAKIEPTGWLLLIHPDFLWNTSLAKKMHTYDFFQYAANEALFMSDKEEATIVDLLVAIEKEYQSKIDKFSQQLIVAQLETLLIYAERFYERQFLTRTKTSAELLTRFDGILTDYFKNGEALKHGIPSVQRIAEQMHISANYLGTLLRLHTEQNTQQHIQSKLIALAKERLSTSALTIGEIAYELGFEHAQSFSKFFKTKTNQSPSDFRTAFQ